MGLLDSLKFWKKKAAEEPTPAPDPFDLVSAWIAEERGAAVDAIEAEIRGCESPARQAKLTAQRLGIEAFAERLLERIAAAKSEAVK